MYFLVEFTVDYMCKLYISYQFIIIEIVYILFYNVCISQFLLDELLFRVIIWLQNGKSLLRNFIQT